MTASPSLVLLNEPTEYWGIFAPLVSKAQATGAKIHDARIAALALVHQVQSLYTADRDFSRFPELKTTNPLL